ncbi:MAG: YqeG family HAD IIIA-type phosphatase [Clostridia bacterium]|nr:YqeG family HAD IIIA-type phosphatase [Clostridia bacterium]
MSVFHPTLLKNRITDLTIEDLETLSVSALLLDVDNTLTRHHSQELDDEVAAWLVSMKEAGVKLMLVSNSKYPRILPFATKIDLPFVHTACKPLPFGFRRAIKALGVPKSACMAIGDQTFTDVLGARLSGMRVTQLIPIEVEAGWSFRLRRRLEKGVLSRYRKKQEKRDRR